MKWCARLALVILFGSSWALPAEAQEQPRLVRIIPTGTAGLGIGEDNTRFEFRYGAGAHLVLVPARRGLPAVVLRVDAQQANIRTTGDGDLLQMVRAEAGIQPRVPITEQFALYGTATAGYGAARIEPAPAFAIGPATASSISYRVGAGLEFVFGRSVAALDVGWDSFVNVYSGFSARVGIGWQFGGRGTSGTADPAAWLGILPQLLGSRQEVGATLTYSDLRLDPVFPVLYKFYDTNPIGSVVVTNDGETALENIEIALDMESYIDNPKISAQLDSLAPGESAQVQLLALFNQEIQKITEGDKVAAVIRASFSVDGREASDEETVTVDFYDRNAIRWDDDNKAAAFVTTRDTDLQLFARNLAALARQNRRGGVSVNLQQGLAMYLGMVDQELAYVVDPTSSYELLSDNPLVVDSVQFPRQTLTYRAGDCDDLSVTYAALLESVGVSTAFITTPGHIFVAFRLEIPATEAERTFSRPQDLIIREDGAWVPIEITLLESGFDEAWATGARQWREYVGSDKARFYPTATAWETYLPVAYTGDEQIGTFDRVSLAETFNRDVSSFVRREIVDRELALTTQLERSPDNVRLRNRLGVLYARYGLTDEARTAFEEAVAVSPYGPALANLGNLAFLEAEYEAAEFYFSQAMEANPEDTSAILGLARVNHELENYGIVSRYYDRIRELDPSLAVQYGYLDLRGGEAARASDAAQLGRRVFWSEEE